MTILSSWHWHFKIFLISIGHFGIFLKSLGLVGIFILSIVDAATIFVPIPIPAAVFVCMATMTINPVLILLVAAFGATLGEFSSYTVGRGGRLIAKKEKWKKMIKITEDAFEKYGKFPVIVLFAACPLLDDVIGLVCGFAKYPVKKYFLAILLGKLLINLIIVCACFFGMHWILSYLHFSA